MYGQPTGAFARTFNYFPVLRAACAALALTAGLALAAAGALAHGPDDNGKGQGKGSAKKIEATGHPAGVHPEVKRFDVTGEGMPSVRGPFPDTENMEFLGQVTAADMGLEKFVGAAAGFLSDIWGWTSEGGEEYAIFGTTSGMAFVCWTDPTDPKFLGIIPTADNAAYGNYWYDVKVYNDHAYWVTEVRNAGIGIMDLNELICEAAERGHSLVATAYWGIDEGEGPEEGYVRAHNISINTAPGLVDRPYLYLTGVSREGADYQNGIMILEIDGDDATNLTLKSMIEAENVDSHDAHIVTYNGPDLAYTDKDILLNFNGGELDVQIWDVSDLDDIALISSFDYLGSGFTHQGWFTEEQDFIILGDEEDELFGISQPRNPNLPDTARTFICNARDLDAVICDNSYDSDAASIDHNLFVKGNKVYQAHYTAGIRVLQINREVGGDKLIESLSEIAHMDTEPRIPNKHMNMNWNVWIGPWGVYPFFDNGTIAASDGLNGLVLMRLDLEE